FFFFFFSSRRRHTRSDRDWSSDVCSSDLPATTRYIWAIAHGGDTHRSRLWLGTDPGGLFRSHDGGASFQLVESLWNHPSRKTGWFGGGRDQPGIHSIVVDPRNEDHIHIGISCAGIFE